MDGRNNALRVMALLTDAYGGIGGIAKFNRDLLYAISRMPNVAEVVALPRLIRIETEDVPAKVQFDVQAAQGARHYVTSTLRNATTSTPLNLIICGHINLLPLAWLVSCIKRCPLVLIVHGIDAWQPHRSWLVRALLARADAIVAVSRYTISRMRKWTELPESKFRLLPNCVDLDIFKPYLRNQSLAKRFKLEGRRVLITVGRLSGHERYKGFDEVIEVMPQLAAEIPDLVYLIVGDGDDRSRLEAKVRQLGIGDRVIFTGFVSEVEKVALYNLADVYVMPSQGEGFGIVYLEAMACGVPVIGSGLDGSRDALRDGQLGQLIDPRDANQIVQSIRIALSKPRGRPAGLEHFSDHTYRERVAVLVHEFTRERH